MLEEVAGYRAEEVSGGHKRSGALLAENCKGYVCREIGKYVVGKVEGESSWLREEKAEGGGRSCLRENLAYIWYLYLFFS